MFHNQLFVFLFLTLFNLNGFELTGREKGLIETQKKNPCIKLTKLINHCNLVLHVLSFKICCLRFIE